MRIIKQIYYDLIKDFFKILNIYIFSYRPEKNSTIEKQTIIINNQYHEDFSWVNYILGNKLKQKGNIVKFLICGGNSYCERMTYSITKPNCKICHLSNIIRLKAFGHDYINTKKFNKDLDVDVEEDNFKNFTKNKFKKLIVNDFDYSLNFNTSFMHYFKGKTKNLSKNKTVILKLYNTTVQTIKSIKRILEIYRPTKIVTIGAKNIQSGILFNQAKLNKISAYSWDVFNQGFKSMFSKDEIAHEQNISNKIWKRFKLEDLSSDKKKEVENYMFLQSKSLSTPWKYYDENIIEEEQKILQELNIDKSKKIISIFPNMDWDSTNVGIDDAFEDSYDFLEKIVKFASKNKDYNVVIRCHPAEAKVDFHARSTRPVNKYIQEEFKDYINDNLILIEASSNISSYSLAKISNHRIVYSSTLGLEFSYLKLKTLVAGRAYYKYRGFTEDVVSNENLEQLLLKSQYNNFLNDNEFQLLEKFIYLSKFRKLFNLDYFKNSQFVLPNLKFIDNSKTYNNITDYIMDKRNYLDLDK